jgi:hypothetical protein
MSMIEKKWYHVYPKEGKPYGFSIINDKVVDCPFFYLVGMHKDFLKRQIIKVGYNEIVYVASNYLTNY